MSGKAEFISWAKTKPWTLVLGRTANASDCPIGRFLAETRGRQVLAVLPDRVVWVGGEEEPLEQGLQQVLRSIDSYEVDTPVTRLGIEYRVESRRLEDVIIDALPTLLEESGQTEFSEAKLVEIFRVMLESMTLEKVQTKWYHSTAAFTFRPNWNNTSIEVSMEEMFPKVQNWYHRHTTAGVYQVIRLFS